MRNPFTIDKSYRIRHKILEVLYKDWEENDHAENRRVGSIKIAKETNIPITKIHRYQHLLLNVGEIVISDSDGQSMMSIQQGGISAYVDRKYIKEGNKNKWDTIYDWSRILISLGALILSIVNYVSNRNLNTKIKNIETVIEKLKK